MKQKSTNAEFNVESFKIYRMQIFLLELKIFINIYQGVIYVYMVDFHKADHNIVLIHLVFSKSLKMQYLGNFVYKGCFANSYSYLLYESRNMEVR